MYSFVINEDGSKIRVNSNYNVTFDDCVELELYTRDTFQNCIFPKLKKITLTDSEGLTTSHVFFNGCQFTSGPSGPSETKLNIEIFGKIQFHLENKKKEDFASIILNDKESKVFLKDATIDSTWIPQHNMTLHCEFGDDLNFGKDLYEKHLSLSNSTFHEIVLKTLDTVFLRNSTCDVLLEDVMSDSKIKIGMMTFINKNMIAESDLFTRAIIDKESSINEDSDTLIFNGNVPDNWCTLVNIFVIDQLQEYKNVTINGNVGRNAFNDFTIFWEKLVVNGSVESFAFGFPEKYKDTELCSGTDQVINRIYCTEITITKNVFKYAFNRCSFVSVEQMTIGCACEDSFYGCCGFIDSFKVNDLYSNLIGIEIDTLSFENISDSISTNASNYNIPTSAALQHIHKKPKEIVYALSKLTDKSREQQTINKITIEKKIETFDSRPILRVPSHLYDNWHCINFENVTNSNTYIDIEYQKYDLTSINSGTSNRILFNIFYETIPMINAPNFISECEELYEGEIYFERPGSSSETSRDSSEGEDSKEIFPNIGLNYVYAKINDKFFDIGTLVVRETTYLDWLSVITPEEYLESFFLIGSIFFAILMFYSMISL